MRSWSSDDEHVGGNGSKSSIPKQTLLGGVADGSCVSMDCYFQMGDIGVNFAHAQA